MNILLLLLPKLERPNSKTSIRLLVLNSLLVTLSPLLLHDELHFAFCMLDYSSLNLQR